MTLIAAAALLGCAVLASTAFAGARTYYTSPTGTGTACTQADPCNLEFAAEEGLNEDSVVVGPGTYALTEQVSLHKAIDFGGAVGSPAPILQTNGGGLRDEFGAGATIHDLRIEGPNGFILASGAAERIFVSYTGTSTEACYVAGTPGDTVFRDSACWAHGGQTSDAIRAEVGKGTGSVILRNDTFVSSDVDGTGLLAEASHFGLNPEGSVLQLSAFNVIARGTDVDVQATTGGEGVRVVTAALSNSNFASVETQPLLTTVTPPGSNGNQVGAPLFVNAAAGDFREAAGSPTVDAGLNDPLNGPLDLAGNARSLPACLGGAPVTDIGAYELVPTSCSAPKPAPAAVFGKIEVEKLKRNKKKGTGTLLVTVSGSGTLTISGKGAKKVSRSSHGSEVVKLPIKPVGKAKKSLVSSGKAKLRLKLKFVPDGGNGEQLTKKFMLIKKSAKPR